MMSLNRRKIIIVAVVVTAVLIVWFVVVQISRIGKIPVTVESSPSNASITIDEKPAHTGINYIAQGSHTFSASKDGYETTDQTVTVDDTNNYIALLPEAISEDAIKEVSSGKESSHAETISGVASGKSGEALNANNPIIGLLPYSDVAGPFKIDFGYNQDNNDKIYLIVSYSTPSGRKNAINWLKKNKLDLTSTEIVFEDFVNPTVNKEENHD